eukprot:scaffold22545_cov126-Isochrysis_galbana.AAC.3
MDASSSVVAARGRTSDGAGWTTEVRVIAPISMIRTLVCGSARSYGITNRGAASCTRTAVVLRRASTASTVSAPRLRACIQGEGRPSLRP